MRGPWPDYINNELLKKAERREGKAISSPFHELCNKVHLQIPRSGDFLAYTRICWMLTQLDREQVMPKVPGAPDLMNWFQATAEPQDGHISFGPSEDFKMRMLTILNALQRVVARPNLNQTAFCPPTSLPVLKGSKTRQSKAILSPVEFVCIWVFCSRHPKLQPSTLAQQINNFRNIVQRDFAGEKKFNSRVVTAFWEFEQGRNIAVRLHKASSQEGKIDVVTLEEVEIPEDDVDMEEEEGGSPSPAAKPSPSHKVSKLSQSELLLLIFTAAKSPV